MTLQKMIDVSEDRLCEIKQLCRQLPREEYERFKALSLNEVKENPVCRDMMESVFEWIEM